MAVELMIAGHHTTRDLIANAVISLLRHPGQLRLLHANGGLMAGAVEEALRFESSIQRGWRRVAEPVDLHGHRLHPGQLVFLMLGSANRDPAQFERADSFEITREPNRHLAFGYGIHFCVGAPLARLEAPVAIAALLARFPRLALPGLEIDWYGSMHVRGPRSLPLSIDGPSPAD